MLIFKKFKKNYKDGVIGEKTNMVSLSPFWWTSFQIAVGTVCLCLSGYSRLGSGLWLHVLDARVAYPFTDYSPYGAHGGWGGSPYSPHQNLPSQGHFSERYEPFFYFYRLLQSSNLSYFSG